MEQRIEWKCALVFFIAAACLLFFVLDAQAFRCGDEIVGTGDSKAKVIIKCGAPTYKEKGAAKKAARVKGDKHTPAGRHAYDKKQSGAKGVEKWSYNCGKDDFIYVLTFEGGVITRIDTDGRGRGVSECLGK